MAVVIGAFWDDVVDVVEDVGEALVDAVDDVATFVAEVPGVDILVEATGDFAKTAVGQVVLRAIASTFTGGLAAFVGPQLASVAFAFPGVMRGEDFDEAWLQEFAWRVEKTAEIVGADAAGAFAADLAKAKEQMFAEFGPTLAPLVNMTAEQIAAHFDIRVDIADMLLKLAKRDMSGNEAFDPVTGKRLIRLQLDRAVGAFSASIPRETNILQLAKQAQIGKSLLSVSANLSRAASSIRISQPVSPAPVPPQEIVRAVAPIEEGSSVVPNVILGVGVVGALGALYWWYQR